MKTIILTIALFGLTAGSYAQDKKDCCCAQKTVKKSTGVKKAVTVNRPATPAKPIAKAETRPAPLPCYSYRSRHNIVVSECPDLFYGDNGPLDMNRESAWLGYYPYEQQSAEAMDRNVKMSGKEAPEHMTIDNYKGLAPADGNFCNGNCTTY